MAGTRGSGRAAGAAVKEAAKAVGAAVRDIVAPRGGSFEPGEEITGTADREEGRVAVTNFGRKVVLNDDGTIAERLMGPPYAWEADEE